ncbi:heat-inducible transcriptional repressor HrcA [Acuticoccus sp. MNP-M23]|uniref:heat-inducible transcriptional repressor HrcA n=1 Tax=Acuticoccus sp. MNP-M23 TaxID=3072793 RepID=UPI002816575B|nr:heat-inducible transcriptional repressor HrcA [Acuticoccus sp. MNP-M23]WMS43988.1 heat-inducible transcriptional repressor HrcA [Acuticoccus sp. MNP-M23]
MHLVDASKTAIELDERSQDIFRQIVETYLATGDPIGSRSLSKALPSPLSPASVRNVMSDLESLGLIYAPHTSAGRLPTDRGLRFFVDALLNVGELSNDERDGIDSELAGQGEGAFDAALTKASMLLSGMSSGAGVVLTTTQDMRVKHIEFVALDPGKGLVVLVGEDGSVENRIVDLPAGLPPSALREATNYLNAHVRGSTVGEARDAISLRAAEVRAELDEITAKLIEEGIASWSGASTRESGSLIVHGRGNLLQNVELRDDVDRVRQLLDDLETKRDLMQLLSLTEDGDGVRIFIGSENKLFSLSGSSLIMSPYRDSQRRVVGVLGIIGPTRLNYAKIIPAVDYTAQVVSKLIK